MNIWKYIAQGTFVETTIQASATEYHTCLFYLFLELSVSARVLFGEGGGGGGKLVRNQIFS